jgi:ubiquinone/menaquinone biosynthesis C-methylase UbiE
METYDIRLKEAKKFLENKKTLDLGCGDGFPTTSIVSPENITAVDINKARLEKNISKHKVFCDITKLPFADKSFPQITLFDVIEHVEKEEDRHKIFKEIYRILEERGTFILSTPNYNRLSTYLRKMVFKPRKYPYATAVIKEAPKTGYHYFEYSKKSLKKELEKIGFKKIKIYTRLIQIPFSKVFLNIKFPLGVTLYCIAEK